MLLLKRIYSIWCCCWFVGLFLLLFPFFFIFLQKEAWKPYAHYLNRLWAKLYFPLCAIPVKVQYASPLDLNQPYLFCANHTSYLDIAVMGLVVPQYFAFIGKSSLKKIPLFGYMFRKLHIDVDRGSWVKSHQTFRRALDTLSQGRSLVVFPEGGIVTKAPPALTPFKDGPFRMAIEQQVPIVPITFPYNWIVLSDDNRLLFTRHLVKVVVHSPIPTQGLTLADVSQLKQQTYLVIENELKRY
jgi:1-acyl-sn-glycerol-3-phosphate acyltransferase